MMIEGIGLNLDKVLKDTRRSPKDFVIPDDKDILVIDQHTITTPVGDILELGKVVGVVQNAEVVDGKIEFDWVVTDDKLERILNNAKHPEKLLTYSPEHYAINPTDEYPQGEVGVLDKIAITNLPNDDGAITQRIYNMIKDAFKKDEGDDMKKEEIETMFNEKLGVLDEIQEAIKNIPDVSEITDKLKTLEENYGKLEDAMKNITEKQEVEKTEMIRNIVANSDFTEEDLKEVPEAVLKNMAEQYTPEPQGLTGPGATEKNIAQKIAEKYGYKIKGVEE